MKKFWENYKRNLRLLAKFGRRHWKVFCISCFASSFIVTAVNFVLSFYVIEIGRASCRERVYVLV